RKMSAPSSKTTVTCDSPNFDTERRSVTCGRPLIERSTGTVTKRSTSSGPSAGAFVRICTWTFVMSGTASIGSVRAALSPSATTTAVSTSTRNRLRRDHWTMCCNMSVVLVCEGGAFELGLERQASVRDDLFPFSKAALNLERRSGARADADASNREGPLGTTDEDDLLSGHALERGRRDRQRGPIVLSRLSHFVPEEPRPTEHAGAKGVILVRHHDANSGASRSVIEKLPDVRHASTKLPPRQRAQRDGD